MLQQERPRRRLLLPLRPLEVVLPTGHGPGGGLRQRHVSTPASRHTRRGSQRADRAGQRRADRLAAVLRPLLLGQVCLQFLSICICVMPIAPLPSCLLPRRYVPSPGEAPRVNPDAARAFEEFEARYVAEYGTELARINPGEEGGGEWGRWQAEICLPVAQGIAPPQPPHVALPPRADARTPSFLLLQPPSRPPLPPPPSLAGRCSCWSPRRCPRCRQLPPRPECTPVAAPICVSLLSADR